jgi:hypothetical protein
MLHREKRGDLDRGAAPPITRSPSGRDGRIRGGNMVLSATVGFDVDGRPAEIFLSGAKDGSGLAAIEEASGTNVLPAVTKARRSRYPGDAALIERGIKMVLDGEAGSAKRSSPDPRRFGTGFFSWDYPAFAEMYARAREVRAHLKFDELLELAETATGENYNAVRLQVDTWKWVLSKMLPRVYGDKLTTEIGLAQSLEQLVLDSIKLREQGAAKVIEHEPAADKDSV